MAVKLVGRQTYINLTVEGELNRLTETLNSVINANKKGQGQVMAGGVNEGVATAAPVFKAGPTTLVGSSTEVVRTDATFPHIKSLSVNGGAQLYSDALFDDTATITVARTYQTITWDVNLTYLSGIYVRRDGTTTMLAAWDAGSFDIKASSFSVPSTTGKFILNYGTDNVYMSEFGGAIYFSVLGETNILSTGGFYIPTSNVFDIGAGRLSLAETGLTHAPGTASTWTATFKDAMQITATGTSVARTMVDIYWPQAGGTNTKNIVMVRSTGSEGTTLQITESGVQVLKIAPTHTLTTTGATPWVFDIGGAVAGDQYTFQANATPVAKISAGGWRAGSYDALAAAALTIGATNATSITIAKSTVPTTIASTSITLGPDSGTTDITLNFKSGSYDASIIFDESVPGFRSQTNWSLGTGASGPPRSSNGTVEVYAASGDAANQVALWAQMTQNQTSSATEYIAYGILGQTNWVVGGTKGDATGCFFTTRVNNVSSKGSSSCELTGAQFKVDCSGTTDSNTIGSMTAGYFRVVPTGDSNTYSTVVGLRVNCDIGGTNNACTNMFGLHLEAFDNAGTGNTLTNGYGIYIVDLTNMQAATTLLDVMHVEAQNGTAAGATKGNIRFAGGDYNTGHVQFENGHVWNDPTNNAIRLYGTTPTASTDGVGFPGLVVTAGASTGTLTNGPWVTTPKNPNAWLEVWNGATKGVVPWWNLS